MIAASIVGILMNDKIDPIMIASNIACSDFIRRGNESVQKGSTTILFDKFCTTPLSVIAGKIVLQIRYEKIEIVAFDRSTHASKIPITNGALRLNESTPAPTNENTMNGNKNPRNSLKVKLIE